MAQIWILNNSTATKQGLNEIGHYSLVYSIRGCLNSFSNISRIQILIIYL